MSGLILELQADALDGAKRVSDLLRKTLAVSRKLDVGDIEPWILSELNGYAAGEVIPKYRRIHGQIKVWNPYHGWQPLNFGDADVGESLSQREINQSVGELDALVASDHNMLQVPFSIEATNVLMKSMEVPLQPTLMVSRTKVIAILDAVRNTILSWALELERRGVIGAGLEFSYASENPRPSSLARS